MKIRNSKYIKAGKLYAGLAQGSGVSKFGINVNGPDSSLFYSIDSLAIRIDLLLIKLRSRIHNLIFKASHNCPSNSILRKLLPKSLNRSTLVFFGNTSGKLVPHSIRQTPSPDMYS